MFTVVNLSFTNMGGGGQTNKKPSKNQGVVYLFVGPKWESHWNSHIHDIAFRGTVNMISFQLVKILVNILS